MKEVVVKYGPRGDRQQAVVKLSGYTGDERLTPTIARAALSVEGVETGEVWETDLNVGYRVYRRSARKIYGEG